MELCSLYQGELSTKIEEKPKKGKEEKKDTRNKNDIRNSKNWHKLFACAQLYYVPRAIEAISSNI